MLVPIALGLSWPDRLDGVDEPCDWTAASRWDFEPLDDEAFPAVRLARQVGEAGRTAPAVYNASNEVGVDAFHEGRIGFLDIVDTVARVVAEHAERSGHGPTEARTGNTAARLTVEEVLQADDWARRRTREMMGLSPQEESAG